MASRSRRFILFRAVARLSIFVDTTNAKREVGRLVFFATNWSCGVETRFPECMRPDISEEGSLYGFGSMRLDGKLDAAGEATAFQYFAAAYCFHAASKSMDAGSFEFFRLIGAFSHVLSIPQ